MSELKYLWLFVFIAFPTAFFLDADNIKAGFVQALFAAGIIAVMTFLFFSIYLAVKRELDGGDF